MGHGGTLSALLIAAVLTGFIHTIAGPDHYLPFIALARMRHYSYCRTLALTVLCGIGHIGSAILLALGFVVLAEFLTASRLEWVESCRGDLAAYAMIGMGGAILLHSLHRRWRDRPRTHRHVHTDGSTEEHTHAPGEIHDHEKLSGWVLFIIFVLGPCEALLPLLTASAVLGTMSVIYVAVLFSLTTIVTMCAAVCAGCYGLQILHCNWLEKFAPELAGGTVMLCGAAIICLGL